MRFGALASWTTSGGEALSTLLLTTPGSAYLTGARAEIDGRLGSTLGGHYIAIPETAGSAVGDHYFYFTQGDEEGVQRGFDPGEWETGSLGGYTSHQVELPFGNISSSQVATILSSSMTGTYDIITQSGSQLTVQSQISASATFFGNSWDERGPAGLWGFRDFTEFSNDFAQSDTTLSHALTPNVSGSIFVRAMSIRVGSVYTTTNRLRLALYQGGVSATDPTGADLVYDFGQIPSGSTDSWYTLWATGTVELTSGSDTWFACISDGTSNTNLNYENSGQDVGDLTSGQNILTANTAIGQDPTVSATGTIGSGFADSGFGFVTATRIHYETTPIVGNGEWKRRYGVHVDSGVVPTNVSFSGTQFCGGNLPIQVSGSLIDYVEMVGSVTPTYRMSIVQGGQVEAPASASVVWDGGQLSGTAAGADWYRITAPTGSSSVPIDLGEEIWIWLKGDGSNGRIHVDVGPPNQISPDDNPMDWPENAGAGSRMEYTTTEANTNHTLDATVAFESPFVSDASDSLGVNSPPYSLGVRTNGFTAVSGS